MIGAWITTNNKILETDNILNHEYQLIITGCSDEICNKNIKFSSTEIKNHLDYDLRYKAFKCGYIRITSFQNQFAIECILSNITNLQLNILNKYVKNTFDIKTFKDFVIEDPMTFNTHFFSSFSDLLDYMKQEIQENK